MRERPSLFLAAALVLAALGGWTRAADAQSMLPRVCTNPDWKARPTASQIFGVWPREAFLKGINGSAKIGCRVSPQGALHDCVVLNEAPPNMGFGLAAIALTPQFLMRPLVCDGQALESQVDIPIQFKGLSSRGASAPAAPQTGSRLPGGSKTDARTAVPGPPANDGPLVLSRVPWLAAPTYAQVVGVYPAEAGAAGLGGHVALNCRFALEGKLGHCDVAAETPTGHGFAAAAKELTRQFVGPARDNDGAPTSGDTTTISFVFDPAMLAGQTPVIGEPQWTKVPDAVDVSAAFPAAARAAKVSVGHVTLGCDVGDGGHLTGCTVTAQSPPGLDFDKAALALSAIFQVSLWTDEGLPTVGGHVVVPIRYEAGDVAPPASPSPGPAAAPGLPVRQAVFDKVPSLYARWNVGSYYPERASREDVSGSAVLECVLGEGGALDSCRAVSESPIGWGFADAALLMAQRRFARLKLGDAAGDPVPGERVWVSLPFESTEKRPAAPVAPSPPPDTSLAVAPPSYHTVVRQVVFAKFAGAYARLNAGPYYPDIAARQGLGGTVVLQCTRAQGGALDDCATISETPEGYGFANAALNLAKRHAIHLKFGDPAGDPDEGEVIRVSVPFEVSGG